MQKKLLSIIRSLSFLITLVSLSLPLRAIQCPGKKPQKVSIDHTESSLICKVTRCNGTQDNWMVPKPNGYQFLDILKGSQIKCDPGTGVDILIKSDQDDAHFNCTPTECHEVTGG